MNKGSHVDISASAGGHGRDAPAGWVDIRHDGERDRHADDPGVTWKNDLGGDVFGGHRSEENHLVPQGPQQEIAANADGMTILIGGFAAAGGEVSMATGVAEVVANDGPGVSISRGAAVFDAHGYGQQPDGAFAATDTYLQVSGADLVLRWDFEGSGSAAGQAWSHSEIDFLAIDVTAWSPPEPIVIDVDQPVKLQPDWHVAETAAFAATVAGVDVHGGDVLSLTSTYAAADSQLSFVYAMALASL